MPGTPFLVEFFNDVRQQMHVEFGGGDFGWDIKIVDGGWDVDHAKASGIEVQLGCDVAENDAELSTMDDRVIAAVSVMAYMRSANVR